MSKIKVMKSPDGKYYWVMYSGNGQVICRSDRHDDKLGALYTASLIKRRGTRVVLPQASHSVEAKGVVGVAGMTYGY